MKTAISTGSPELRLSSAMNAWMIVIARVTKRTVIGKIRRRISGRGWRTSNATLIGS